MRDLIAELAAPWGSLQSADEPTRLRIRRAATLSLQAETLDTSLEPSPDQKSLSMLAIGTDFGSTKARHRLGEMRRLIDHHGGFGEIDQTIIHRG